jgi:hypothetical protein
MKIVIKIDPTKIRKKTPKIGQIHRDRKNDYKRHPKHKRKITQESFLTPGLFFCLISED